MKIKVKWYCENCTKVFTTEEEVSLYDSNWLYSLMTAIMPHECKNGDIGRATFRNINKKQYKECVKECEKLQKKKMI